jgi:hypothetical protein
MNAFDLFVVVYDFGGGGGKRMESRNLWLLERLKDLWERSRSYLSS